VEFYNDSPATNYFVDKSVVLSGERKQDAVTREWSFTERIFYANYYMEDMSLCFSIFDDVTRSYVLEPVYLTEYKEAESLLRDIAKQYPGKIQIKKFLTEWAVYFTAVEEAVFLHGKVSDIDGSCGQCDDYNRDEFIFLYVPAVPGTPLNEPSLGIHWDYGCFGGTKITGVLEDVVDDVQALLPRMHEQAESKYKKDIQEMINILAKVNA
jgi:hypothetical protein